MNLQKAIKRNAPTINYYFMKKSLDIVLKLMNEMSLTPSIILIETSPCVAMLV